MFFWCRFEVDALVVDYHNPMVTQHLFENFFTNTSLIDPLHFQRIIFTGKGSFFGTLKKLGTPFYLPCSRIKVMGIDPLVKVFGETTCNPEIVQVSCSEP